MGNSRFQPLPGAAGRLLALLVLLLGAGCSTTVQLESAELPAALINPYPLTVAVRYDASLETFVHSEELPSGDKFKIDLGAASRDMFATTFADMFDAVIEVAPGAAPPEGIDLLIEPSIEALEFALPSQTVTKDYTVWIKFNLKVYNGLGALQTEYAIASYAKAAADSLMASRTKALTFAARNALRDAGVLLITRFADEAKLAQNQLLQPESAVALPVADDNVPGRSVRGAAAATAETGGSDDDTTSSNAEEGEQFL